MKKKYLFISLFSWVIIVLGSLLWNLHIVRTNTINVVKSRAEALFDQMVTTRLWNSNHGGVYIPVTEKDQPNQYLKHSKRDIITTEGQLLTMINPAYMTRQIAELSENRKQILYHITSLNPIRPQNKADSWETEALQEFENNQPFKLEKVLVDSVSLYRYMAPLVTVESCLQCHREQGYRVGDIRGGISVSFPSIDLDESHYKLSLSLIIVHIVIFLIGVSGLIIYNSQSNKFFAVLNQKNKELMIKEDEQKKLNNELRKSNTTKDKLFSIIAHDLKNPMNVILGFSELLNESIENNNLEESKTQIGYLRKSSKQVTILLENLLNWSKFQKSSINYNPRRINIRALIDENILFQENQAKLKEIKLENKLKNDIFCFADIEMVNVILRNLISNAIKFTPYTGLVYLDVIESDNHIQINVVDKGVGMTTEEIDKLFKIEETFSTLGTEKESGTGLGLILCKEFVLKNNGEIYIYSEKGKGSKFVFTLPKA